MTNSSRDNQESKVTSGVIVLGIGLYFLGINMDILPPVGESWPLFLVIVGLALIIKNFKGKRSNNDTTVPPPPPPS